MRGRIGEIVRFGPFEYRGVNGLWRGAAEVTLPPRALTVLGALVARPGEVISKAELLEAGWRDAFVTDASLTEAIRVLRVALGDASREPAYVQTVHRRGYRFVAAVSVEAAAAVPVRPVPVDASPGSAADAAVPVAGRETAGRDDVWRPFLRAGLAALAFTAASAIGALVTAAPTAASTARLSIALPDDVRVDALQGGVAVAPDGSRIAFVAEAHGEPLLFVRDVREFEAREVRGSAGARDPFFSPDGRRVGFFAGGRLTTASVDGGDLRVVAAVAAGAGATWRRDGSIVFGGAHGRGLARAASSGNGEATPIAVPAPGSADVRFGWPEDLPGRDGVLFTVVTPAGADLAITDGSPAGYRVIARDAQFGRFAAPGMLVAERDGRLLAARVTHDGRALAGPFAPAVADVATTGVLGGPRFAVSASGALVYVPGAASGPQGLRWVRNPAAITAAALAEALVLDRDAGSDARLTAIASGIDGAGVAVQPAWRPDGLEVAFALNKSGPYNLFVQPGLGGVATPLGASPWNQAPTSWSPDGRTLIFTEYHPITGADVWALDLATRARRPVARTASDETGARFSPDGRWIAYLTNERGMWDVVVRSTVDGAARARLDAAGLVPGRLGPAWQGRELRVVLAWGRELLRASPRASPPS